MSDAPDDLVLDHLRQDVADDVTHPLVRENARLRTRLARLEAALAAHGAPADADTPETP